MHSTVPITAASCRSSFHCAQASALNLPSGRKGEFGGAPATLDASVDTMFRGYLVPSWILSPAFSTSLPNPWAVLQPVLTTTSRVAMQSSAPMCLNEVSMICMRGVWFVYPSQLMPAPCASPWGETLPKQNLVGAWFVIPVAWGIHPIPRHFTIGRVLPSAGKARMANCRQPRIKNMKYLLPIIPIVIAASLLMGCDNQNAAIDDKRDVTKTAIDNEKKAVDAAAVEAKKQADVDATVDKAKIEAKKLADQAQLDADKKKADAKAELEKSKLEAEKK